MPFPLVAPVIIKLVVSVAVQLSDETSGGMVYVLFETLQKGEGDGQVKTGGVTSLVQVTVLAIVAVFPQASVAVNILVCDRLQLLL